MQNKVYRVQIPQKPIPLMKSIYQQVLPKIQHQLSFWKRKANQIPDLELRKQALASIQSKQFHCEGGGVYALLAPELYREQVYRFIVAYQTISDYLDNLCDRSVSLDPLNFRRLHQAMLDAITGETSQTDYYEYQDHREDGGYLEELVSTCQQALQQFPQMNQYRSHMRILAQMYCDLQVYKHIALDKREAALQEWWSHYQTTYGQLEWYEFAAATGSTLGIFYYSALASFDHYSPELDYQVFQAYFPYVQGLHILLDYLIDQEEDRRGGDLNFCFYYENEAEKQARFMWIYEQAKQAIDRLPHADFHRMVVDGLVSIYLADPKVKKQRDVKKISKSILKQGSWTMKFLHWNGWLIHRNGLKV